MNLVLVISTIFMYFITKSYNSGNHFKIFWIDVLVQVLHIITLLFIFLILAKNTYLIYRIFSFFCFYVLIKNIECCVLNIYYFFNQDDDDDDNKEER